MPDAPLPLTGPQRKQLYEALLAAFPTPAELSRVVLFHLDAEYARFLYGDDHGAIVLSLISKAVARGEVREFVTAARAENDTNPVLRAFADQLLPPPAPPPASPALTPVERATRYRALKEALAAGEWQRVVDLATGLETYRDVAECVARARDELARLRRLLEELAGAYAAGEWAQVLLLARKPQVAAPPDWLTRAWHELPVEVKVLTGHTGSVWAVALSADGRLALSGAGELFVEENELVTSLTGALDNTLRLWDLINGQCLGSFKGPQPMLAVAFSADGKQALSYSYDATLRRWNIATGQILRTFANQTLRTLISRIPILKAVSFSANGRLALSGSYDGRLQLWDAITGQQLRTFTGRHTGLWALVLSADGRLAFSGSGSGTLRVWDVATGHELRTFTGHDSAVWAVALNAGARLGLSGAGDSSLRLWDVATGKCLRTFIGHTDWVTAVALSAEGRLALSGSRDMTVRLWDVATGQCLRTFIGHTNWVWAVALSADGRTFASASQDGTVRVWTLPGPLLA